MSCFRRAQLKLRSLSKAHLSTWQTWVARNSELFKEFTYTTSFTQHNFSCGWLWSQFRFGGQVIDWIGFEEDGSTHFILIYIQDREKWGSKERRKRRAQNYLRNHFINWVALSLSAAWQPVIIQVCRRSLWNYCVRVELVIYYQTPRFLCRHYIIATCLESQFESVFLHNPILLLSDWPCNFSLEMICYR